MTGMDQLYKHLHFWSAGSASASTVLRNITKLLFIPLYRLTTEIDAVPCGLQIQYIDTLPDGTKSHLTYL